MMDTDFRSLADALKESSEPDTEPKEAPQPVRAPPVIGSSRYNGVRFSNDKWQARVRHLGENVCAGFYATEEEAARAVDCAASLLYEKDGLRANFPGDNPRRFNLPAPVFTEMKRHIAIRASMPRK
jgi:hypothetical protein